MKFSNLLLIAGTGTDTGKTTFACRMISQLREKGIVAVKITPHFHETTPGLMLQVAGAGYVIYTETDRESSKDTSRMLRAGASAAWFAKVTDETLMQAFSQIMERVGRDAPVVCESTALRHFVTPAVFVIMDNDTIPSGKKPGSLLSYPHLEYTTGNLPEIIPIDYINNEWRVTQ